MSNLPFSSPNLNSEQNPDQPPPVYNLPPGQGYPPGKSTGATGQPEGDADTRPAWIPNLPAAGRSAAQAMPGTGRDLYAQTQLHRSGRPCRRSHVPFNPEVKR